jgi:RNA polymerase sigma-70 factor (ECF subfamily)
MRRRADARDFSALYDQTNADLLAFLLRRCPTAEDAADCLAETYLVAWRKRDRIPTGPDARPWLFGVARNVVRQAHQRHHRFATAATALAAQVKAANVLRPEPLGREPERLRDALNALSDIDREIITLIAWDELTPTEVAQVLGLSANVVRVRAHRARAKLKAILGTSTPHRLRSPAGSGHQTDHHSEHR